MRSCTERHDLGGPFPLKMSPNHYLITRSGGTEMAPRLIIVMGHKSHVSSVHWEEGEATQVSYKPCRVAGVLMAIVTVVI